jgi:ABC-type Fe3+ transport system substrate-binding protein
MKKIVISLPLPVMPVAQSLTQKLEELATDTRLEFKGLDPGEDEPLPLEGDDIPELVVTHHVSIIKHRDAMVSSGAYGAFEGALPRMRDDLREKGFVDPSGCFVPMCFVPIVLIYDKSIEAPPSSWADLLEKRWQGRIGSASTSTFAKLLKANLEGLVEGQAEQLEQLFASMDLKGLPIRVNLAVGEGELDVGIAPLPFARASRTGNVSMCWPEEGAICVPHVLIYKKGAHKDAIKIGRYLLSDEAQRLIAAPGLIPVSPNVPLPEEVVENKLNFYWQGWDWFIERLNSI